MKPVWRISSRWSRKGEKTKSVLDSIFLQYDIAFIGFNADDKSRTQATYKKILNVRENDLAAIADGAQIIAIGIATTPTAHISKFDFPKLHDKDVWFTQEENAWGFRVKIYRLRCEDYISIPSPPIRFEPAPKNIATKIRDLAFKYMVIGL